MLVAQRAAEKNLELAVMMDPVASMMVRGDPGRIRQVLLNILGNAIKFTEAGEVVLRVRIAADQGAVAEILFEVTDTGIGVAVDQQGSLFESFTQADASTTRRFGGTGLGLAICKQLVERMGGEIGVRSTGQGGSAFWFTLPLPRTAGSHVRGPSDRTGLHAVRAPAVYQHHTHRHVGP